MPGYGLGGYGISGYGGEIETDISTSLRSVVRLLTDAKSTHGFIHRLAAPCNALALTSVPDMVLKGLRHPGCPARQPRLLHLPRPQLLHSIANSVQRDDERALLAGPEAVRARLSGAARA